VHYIAGKFRICYHASVKQNVTRPQRHYCSTQYLIEISRLTGVNGLCLDHLNALLINVSVPFAILLVDCTNRPTKLVIQTKKPAVGLAANGQESTLKSPAVTKEAISK
jgi:hypothetical protein